MTKETMKMGRVVRAILTFAKKKTSAFVSNISDLITAKNNSFSNSWEGFLAGNESCNTSARAGRAFCVQKNLPRQAASASELTTSIASTVSLFGKNRANNAILSRTPVTNATLVALLNILCGSFIFTQTAYGALNFNMDGGHNA